MDDRKEKLLKSLFREDLQSIIEFIADTDSEITDYVKEIKNQWK